jgi:hypothetical protein
MGEDVSAENEKCGIGSNRILTEEETRELLDLSRRGYPHALNRAHPLAKGLVGMWVSQPDGSWRDLTRPRPADDAPVPLDALVKPETWHDRPGML